MNKKEVESDNWKEPIAITGTLCAVRSTAINRSVVTLETMGTKKDIPLNKPAEMFSEYKGKLVLLTISESKMMSAQSTYYLVSIENVAKNLNEYERRLYTELRADEKKVIDVIIEGTLPDAYELECFDEYSNKCKYLAAMLAIKNHWVSGNDFAKMIKNYYSRKEDKQNLQTLQKILTVGPIFGKALIDRIDIDKVSEIRLDGQEMLINDLVMQIKAGWKKRAFKPIILVGESGCGKSELLYRVAKTLNIDYEAFFCGEDIVSFVGSSQVYSNASLGGFPQMVLQNRLGIIEINGVTPQMDKCMLSIIEEILCRQRIYSEYLGAYLDLSRFIIVATVIGNENIPYTISQSCTVLNFNQYSSHDKLVIAKQYANETEIEISDAALREIGKISGENIREMLNHIDRVPTGRKIGIGQLKEYIPEIKRVYELQNGERVQSYYDALLKSRVCQYFHKDTIVSFLHKYEMSSANDTKRSYFLEALQMLTDAETHDSECVSLEEHRNRVCMIYGREIEKNALYDMVQEVTLSQKRPKPILFVGAPGTGKTSLCKAFFGNLQVIPMNFLDCCLEGLSYEHADGKVGELLAAYAKGRSDNCAILLDEVDKVKNWGPLYSILNREEDCIRDRYTGALIRIPSYILMTANDISGVPEAIISRCRVVYTRNMTAKEQMECCKLITIPEILSSLGLQDCCMDDEAIEYLIEHINKPGMREIRDVISQAFITGTRENVTQISVCYMQKIMGNEYYGERAIGFK